MVAVPKERSFPRGGREDQLAEPKKKLPDWCKKTSKAFNKKTNGRQKNNPFERRRNAKTIPEQIEGKDKKTKDFQMRPYTGILKYPTITEGMLILGSIYQIKPYELVISLPGNCIGHVPITNISEYYTGALKSLTKSSNSEVHLLRDMFRIGQHVVTKVVKKECFGSDNRHKIILSLAPDVIHSECSSEDILEETVFCAAVVSVQEKGYVMDLGIKSVRAFLNKDNSKQFEKIWNKGKALGIGQLVRCLVADVTTANLITTVVLTADPELVPKASNNNTGSRLQGMLPGMLFKVTVARHVFPSGLQVRLSDNVMGYVPPNHFPKNFKKPEDFEVGRVHWARIIYISASGAIFFSMKSSIFPARPSVSPFKVLKAGFVTDSAIVWDVSKEGLTVRLGKAADASLKAFIPVKHISRTVKEPEPESESSLAEQLLNEFPIGAKVTCRVMDYSYMDQLYICTMDEHLMKEKYLHPSALKTGTLVSCIVKQITPKGVIVALGKHSPVTGLVPILHVSNVPLTHLDKKFSVGQTCPAKVLSLDNHVQLTMKQLLIDSNRNLSSFENAGFGKTYPGTIVLIKKTGILVEFYNSVTAFVVRAHLGPVVTDEGADISETFFVGQVVNCTIIGKVKETQKLIMSLVNKQIIAQEDGNEVQEAKDEVVTDNGAGIKKDKHNKSKSKENKLSLKSGTSFQEQAGLKRKNKQSIAPTDFSVPENETTPSKKLKLSPKSNETGKDLDKAKKNRKLSTASMDSEVVSGSEIEPLEETTMELHVEETTSAKKKKNRKSKSASMDFEVVSGSEIKPVENVEETSSAKKNKNRKSKSASMDFEVVSGIESERVENVDEISSTKKKKNKKKKSKSGNISSEIPDAEINSDLEMNSSCEITTTKSSKKAKKIMKSSFRSNGDDSVASMTNGTGKKKGKRETDHATLSTSKQQEHQSVDSDSSEEDEPVELPPLSAATGFVWDATPSSLAAGASCEEDSSDDELVETKKVKRSRQAIIAEKRLQAQIEEARLRSIEQRLMDPDQLPQTADEFDRLVLSSPDNSMVWLQYMAHHIQATEIDKARSIAQRALKTISFREEQEKLNVWVAWLNLENLYGTNESMKNTFEEAIRLNDPYQVYTQTLQIYADSHKLQDGDDLIAVMTRKFKTNKDMWINVATFYMKSGQMVKARALLQRALASLEQKEHVSVITQFALLENKLGTKERAQTLMEQILTSYPKRVDVWSVYVDMLIKSDLVDMARQVLERAVAQRLPSHKMKTLFKKFLAFEESHGTEEGANKVRQLALDYVEAAAGTTME